MENYQFNSIDELLKNIPSIELQSKGDFGVQSDITMRGTTFSQTLVLLDGMRVNDPLTGHFSMYIPINPSEIHQIEIIRGGNSSIYGPDAVGGLAALAARHAGELAGTVVRRQPVELGGAGPRDAERAADGCRLRLQRRAPRRHRPRRGGEGGVRRRAGAAQGRRDLRAPGPPRQGDLGRGEQVRLVFWNP